MPALADRPRLAYALATATTVALGLASRHFAAQLPSFVGAYVGDALWAAMVFFGISIFVPRVALRARAAIALAYCVATELSQLYHAPWIDALRATRLGGLVLGFGFLWSDLVAYTVGVVAAAVLAREAGRRFTAR